jgi:hypothetical protein
MNGHLKPALSSTLVSSRREPHGKLSLAKSPTSFYKRQTHGRLNIISKRGRRHMDEASLAARIMYLLAKSHFRSFISLEMSWWLLEQCPGIATR